MRTCFEIEAQKWPIQSRREIGEGRGRDGFEFEHDYFLLPSIIFVDLLEIHSSFQLL